MLEKLFPYSMLDLKMFFQNSLFEVSKIVLS